LDLCLEINCSGVKVYDGAGDDNDDDGDDVLN
jgi:hypothetical protein